MSEFIEKKHGLFEGGKVFYEFDEHEDLLYCKEIVVMRKNRWKLYAKVSNILINQLRGAGWVSKTHALVKLVNLATKTESNMLYL